MTTPTHPICGAQRPAPSTPEESEPEPLRVEPLRVELLQMVVQNRQLLTPDDAGTWSMGEAVEANVDDLVETVTAFTRKHPDQPVVEVKVILGHAVWYASTVEDAKRLLLDDGRQGNRVDITLGLPGMAPKSVEEVAWAILRDRNGTVMATAPVWRDAVTGGGTYEFVGFNEDQKQRMDPATIVVATREVAAGAVIGEPWQPPAGFDLRDSEGVDN